MKFRFFFFDRPISSKPHWECEFWDKLGHRHDLGNNTHEGYRYRNGFDMQEFVDIIQGKARRK